MLAVLDILITEFTSVDYANRLSGNIMASYAELSKVNIDESREYMSKIEGLMQQVLTATGRA